MMFSIITPSYIYDVKRGKDLLRCVSSVVDQSLTDYEHIIIDQTDNSEFAFNLDKVPQVKLINQLHIERLFAVREGLEKSQGEWICFLDSDDMYLPHYLETVKDLIIQNPEYKMFNFGSVHIQRDKSVRVRDAFKPAFKEVGHEIFSSGTIVNGTFVFHRSLWEEMGDFPKIEKLWNPWDFSIAAQEEFPEIKPMFIVDHPDHPNGCPKELGNPWGQDYYLFYKYTRKYHSLPVDKHLYVVYSK